MRNGLVALASGVMLTACSVVGVRTVEEPPFTVKRQAGPLEVRSYGPRLAAEVLVAGDEIDARSAGFRQVAAYIFGANRSRATIAMTAPVAQSQSIDMTAPVDQSPQADGRWRVRFFMPASYTRATLPEPTDPRVQIVDVPEQTVAVLRYSGLPTATAGQDATRRLLAALDGTGLHAVGTPMSWFYDPPWTIPPLRRNEAAVEVAG